MKLQPLKRTIVGLALSLTIGGFAVPAEAAQAAQTHDTYVTQQNDTFWTVSQKLHVNLDELMAANPAVHYLNVYQGLTLKIPAGERAANSVKVKAAAVPAPLKQPSAQTASGSYNKIISGVATAYSEAAGENGGWGGLDYFGKPLQIGTIAVDPKVIPLGTKVLVTGYTYQGLPKSLLATTSDVGGAIRGNRIDIFIPTTLGNVSDFGIQNVKLHLLK